VGFDLNIIEEVVNESRQNYNRRRRLWYIASRN